MIAATATFAAAATEASAQQASTCDPLTGAACSSSQVQTGDVLSSVNLDVGVGQLQVSVQTRGNALSGGIEGVSGSMTSSQRNSGVVRGDVAVALDGAENGAAIDNHVRGNDFQAYTGDAVFTVDARQLADGAAVQASSVIAAGDSAVIGGGYVATSATANNVAVGGPRSQVLGSIDQTAQTTVFSETVADIRYVPATASFSSRATANAAQAGTTGSSHQDLSFRQENRPSTTVAQTDVYIDNAWDVSADAQARANYANAGNEGGSMVIRTDQSNAGRVRAETRLRTDLYGAAVASARAVANEAIAGNDDIYLSLDNTQINTGGVEAVATFQGNTGYDAYVGADAIGNAVTGSVCSTCGGEVNVTNTQVNSGDVSAVVNVGAGRTGGSRAAVVGANAVGNSATFYVSRPGG
ncbi:MAG: holdfast anchor protein HfaD [Brevundimonas sp.]|nr:holdfast anchor protein HfaD [Brevundimonas sp.]